MGVVVRRYIDILTIIINFPYSTCISSFLAAASLLLCSFLKCFFGLVIYKERYINKIDKLLSIYSAPCVIMSEATLLRVNNAYIF